MLIALSLLFPNVRRQSSVLAQSSAHTYVSDDECIHMCADSFCSFIFMCCVALPSSLLVLFILSPSLSCSMSVQFNVSPDSVSFFGSDCVPSSRVYVQWCGGHNRISSITRTGYFSTVRSVSLHLRLCCRFGV